MGLMMMMMMNRKGNIKRISTMYKYYKGNIIFIFLSSKNSGQVMKPYKSVDRVETGLVENCRWGAGMGYRAGGIFSYT